MYARVTIAKSEAAAEESASYIREKILPQARSLEGFKGILDLMDPETGDGMTVTLWEEEAAMKASEEAANAMRAGAVRDLGEAIIEVKRFEVNVLEI